MATIKATRTADLLAAMPRLLNYQPENSLVIVPMMGRKTAGAIRLDLPEANGSEEVQTHAASEWVKTVSDILKRLETKKFLMIIYTNENSYNLDTVEETISAPFLTGLLAVIALKQNVEVIEYVTVTPEGYYTQFIKKDELPESIGRGSKLQPLTEITNNRYYEKPKFESVEEWRSNSDLCENVEQFNKKMGTLNE